jgi:hypothetical protein
MNADGRETPASSFANRLSGYTHDFDDFEPSYLFGKFLFVLASVLEEP